MPDTGSSDTTWKAVPQFAKKVLVAKDAKSRWRLLVVELARMSEGVSLDIVKFITNLKVALTEERISG